MTKSKFATGQRWRVTRMPVKGCRKFEFVILGTLRKGWVKCRIHCLCEEKGLHDDNEPNEYSHQHLQKYAVFVDGSVVDDRVVIAGGSSLTVASVQAAHTTLVAQSLAMPPLRFRDIPQFPRAHYEVDVPWSCLEDHLKRQLDAGLDLEPDFQRAHVWTKAQQTAYVEHILQGGEVGRNITFNHRSWDKYIEVADPGEYTVVDGKQRLEAVRAFLRGEVQVFGGHVFADFTDRLPIMECSFRFRICKLPTEAEVLKLYLSINAGGTPHKPDEIAKVREMLLQKEGSR